MCSRWGTRHESFVQSDAAPCRWTWLYLRKVGEAVLKPDGIIIDINMPKIDGIEATKQIKVSQPMICIIGLSVIDDEHVRQAMRAAGGRGGLAQG